MLLIDLFPDADAVCALEPDELGLRMLPVLASRNQGRSPVIDPGLQVSDFLPDEQLRDYPDGRRPEIRLAVREAWAWLEGVGFLIEHPDYLSPNRIRILSRRAKRLAREGDPPRAFSARRIPKESLHTWIREDVWALYHRGKYDTAVFEAIREVEIQVREAAGLSAGDYGPDLMRRAFNPTNGALTDMTALESERIARSALFAGAIGSYKNPQSHRRVGLDDPDEAAEIIILANHLLRIVDTRREALGQQKSAPA